MSSDAVTLYRHDGSLECVWGVHAFVCDGQSAVASVSSDGTFRCAFTSPLAEFIGSKHQGSSAAGRAARSTLDLWVLEAFRFEGSQDNQAAAGDCIGGCSGSNKRSCGWEGHIATVKVRAEATLQVTSGTIAHTAPSVAIHAVDSCPCHSDTGSYHPTCRMFAYGGVAGILRVHTIDFLSSVVHCDGVL